MKLVNLFFLLLALAIISCKTEKEKPKTEATDTSNSNTIEESANSEEKKSTAQPNVIILDQAFEMPGLDRTRQIRIYLPPNYNNSDKKYPVLYMHDAQNLFDDATSYAGEWGVDESLNELSKSKDLDLIVIGIDNGAEKRMNELSPWENKEFGQAEGKAYMDFIVKVIKPYIDKQYRTLTDKEHTAIMGSSMGGLISHYAIYEYPDVFSKAGIFSPSYWYHDQVFSSTKENPVPKEHRLFLLVGEKEGGNMDSDTQKMYDLIAASGHPVENLYINIDPNGTHSEDFWKAHFPTAISWLFAE